MPHYLDNAEVRTYKDYLNNLLLPLGAQIIDLMMLVIDITKGIQTQTAEVNNMEVYMHRSLT